MKIKKFDSKNLELLRDEMNNYFAKIEKKYGVDMRIGNMSYNADEVRAKVEIKMPDASVKQFAQVAKWDSSLDDFTESPINKQFKDGRFTFTVSQFNPSRPKNCFSLVRNDGRRFKCSASYLKSFKLYTV